MDNYIVRSEYVVERLKYNSISELIFDKLSENSSQNLIIDCSSGEKWSRKQVLDLSLNFAYYLINDCKLSKDDIILFAMDDSVLHAIGLLGVLLAGGVYTGIAKHVREYEIRIKLMKIKPLVVICCEDYYQIITNCCKDYPFIQKVLLIDNKCKKSLHLSQQTFEDICNTLRKPDIELPVAVEQNDIATLVTSGGTTGFPKIIIKTHQNHLSGVESSQHKDFYLTTSEKIVLLLPLNGMGQLYLFDAINVGAQLAVINKTDDIEYTYNCIHKYNIRHAFLVPTELNFLVRNYEYYKNYLKSLRHVVTAGEPLAESTYRFIAQNFNCDILIFIPGYGMTETGINTLVPISASKYIQDVSTVGKVCPNIEIKVIDELGNSLPTNTRGEICVRGGQVIPGYYQNDEQNKLSFTFDGFFKTGDLGYYDHNYYFFIVGRIKECIVVYGNKVFSPELEDLLMTNPNVINAAVIGVKDEERGEVPMAFVTVVEGSTVTVNELLDFVNSRVDYYKQLRGGLKIIDKMPVNSYNKIMKLKLKEMI